MFTDNQISFQAIPGKIAHFSGKKSYYVEYLVLNLELNLINSP